MDFKLKFQRLKVLMGREMPWFTLTDGYVADAARNRKWGEVSDAGEAAFRNQDPNTKP
jgi:hypothetical protein